MFVSRLEPGQYNVEQWLVTRDQGVVRRQERVARMGTQQQEDASSGQDATMEDVSGDIESGVVEPAVEQPALTTPAEIPPPDQESVFPASLLSVPLLSSTTPAAAQDLSALPPAWIPIISRDQSDPVPRSHPYSDAYLSGQPR